jgi:hypothetical protein
MRYVGLVSGFGSSKYVGRDWVRDTLGMDVVQKKRVYGDEVEMASEQMLFSLRTSWSVTYDEGGKDVYVNGRGRTE